MPRCPGCGFLHNVQRGSCPECGRDLTLPVTENEEAAESQQRKVEAEWARQRTPTRMERWVMSFGVVMLYVAGISLLLLAGCTTLVGWSGRDDAIPGALFGREFYQSMFETGLLGVLLAVGLLAIAVLAWRHRE